MNEIDKYTNKVNKSILFWTIVYIIIILLITKVLDSFNLTLLGWIKDFSMIICPIGVVLGTIQIIVKHVKNRRNKIILCIVIVIMELFIALFIGCAYILFTDHEKIIYTDDGKMIKETHSSLLSNWINYYDYKNIFVRSKQVKIFEAHDDRIGEYLYTIYYDENGNVIKKDEGI